MKYALTITLVATALSTPANAAAIDLFTFVSLASNAENTIAAEEETFDTATDVAAQFMSIEASQATSNINGFSASGVDLDLGASRAIARVNKAAGNTPARAVSLSKTTVKDTYSVSGNGKVIAAFTIYGDITSTTDLPNPGQYLEALGTIDIMHNSAVFDAAFSTQDASYAFFQLANGAYNQKLEIEFDVSDGDTFDIATEISAKIAFDEFIAAFLEFEVDVKSGLRVYGVDGAAISPSPVPLPATLFLLLAPIAGVFELSRRRRPKAA